jgi:hypothetical protein
MAGGGHRDVTKEKFWRRLIRKQAVSRLGVRAWCHRHGHKESAFYWWRMELARRDAGQPGRKPARTKLSFIPVHVAPASAAIESSSCVGRIEIVLGDDRRVQVVGRVDREALVAVLSALEASPC